MTGKLSKKFHGVGIGPLSKILPVKNTKDRGLLLLFCAQPDNASCEVGLRPIYVQRVLGIRVVTRKPLEESIEPIKTVFTYVLFILTHSL